MKVLTLKEQPDRDDYTLDHSAANRSARDPQARMAGVINRRSTSERYADLQATKGRPWSLLHTLIRPCRIAHCAPPRDAWPIDHPAIKHWLIDTR